MSDPSPASKMADFSGRLSPMLVKELRQGLRTNLFVVAFILLQTFMVLCLMAGLADPNSNDADGFFWFFIIVTLLLVQPLRGFSALSSEYALNTMDLVQLTRLDGWRIVLGKWTALNAQSVLFITGVLPYLVIRYFMGNVDFVADLILLGTIGLGSALATSFTIGLSVFKSVLLRGIIVGVTAFFGLSMFGTIGFAFSMRASSYTFAGIALTVLAAGYGCFFFLSFGASRVAPLSENHAVRKRLTAIGFAILPALFLFGNIDKDAVIPIAGVILGLACIDALTEPLPIYSRVLSSSRKNPLSRFFALFLTPGWLSGIAFFLVCCGIWLGLFFLVDLSGGDDFLKDDGGPLMFLSCCNLIIFPLLFIHLFFSRHASNQFTFGFYTFIQLALAMFTLLVGVMGNALGGRHEDWLYLGVPIPSVLITASNISSLDNKLFFGIAIATTILCVTVPLLRNREAVRDFSRNLKPRK